MKKLLNLSYNVLQALIYGNCVSLFDKIFNLSHILMSLEVIGKFINPIKL